MALPLLDDKVKLVEELFSERHRLYDNKLGLSVVEACAMDIFVNDGTNTEWRNKIISRMVALALSLALPSSTEEIVHTGNRSSTTTTTNMEDATATDTTINEGGGETTTTKAKRKSSRRKRSTNDTNDIDKSRKKARRESSLGCTMGYIMRYH